MSTIKHLLLPEEAQYMASAFPAYQKNIGTNFPISALAYDGSAEEKAYWKLKASNYLSGNLTLVIRWYADATSNAVVWACRLAAITPSDAGSIEAKAFATQVVASPTNVLGTTAKRLNETVVTVNQLDSLAVDDEVYLEISRLPANAGDTLASDAMLTEAELYYTGS